MTTSDHTTFKPCSICGTPKPLTEYHKCKQSADGHKSACKPCRCASTRDYVHRNPEKVRESKRQWENDNREIVNTRLRKYAQDYPERVKSTKRKSAEKHKEKRRLKNADPQARERKRQYDQQFYLVHMERKKTQVRQWNAQNREHVREHHRNKRLLNPERYLAYGRNARARKRNAQGSHTATDIRLQFKAQGGNCWWCGKSFQLGEYGSATGYHVDHRIPLHKGGSNDAGNLCLACPPCNLSKNNKLPHEWNGRLL